MLLELLGHVFKIIEEYGLLVFCFSFWSILFFCIGFLIGIFLNNAVFKRFKTTNEISISPFLIGIWLAFLVAYILSDYLYITKKRSCCNKISFNNRQDYNIFLRYYQFFDTFKNYRIDTFKNYKDNRFNRFIYKA